MACPRPAMQRRTRSVNSPAPAARRRIRRRRMDALPWIALAVLVGVPAYAWSVRGRGYATFGFVILAIALPGALVMHHRLTEWAAPGVRPWLDVLFAYGVIAAGAHLAHLVRARLR